MENQYKYPIGGYPPGNYVGKCSTCKKEFIGDKRAVQCEPCAIKMTEEETQSLIENNREIAERGGCKPIHQQIIETCGGEKEFMKSAGLLPKQETLEEVLERYFPVIKELEYNVEYKSSIAEKKLAFMFGAKWQKEQICNSEVLQKIRATKSDSEARRIIRVL